MVTIWDYIAVGIAYIAVGILFIVGLPTLVICYIDKLWSKK